MSAPAAAASHNVQVAQRVAAGIAVVAKIAAVEKGVMPYATFIAGFFPGAASVLSAIAIAQPFIDKAIAAAPAVEEAVIAGAPIIGALQANGPEVLDHLKTAFAIFHNSIPGSPQIAPADVSDETAVRFAGPVMFGRPWTQEEQQRAWDKATGQGF